MYFYNIKSKFAEHLRSFYISGRCKNNVKMTFRGWGVKMCDVSRLLLTGYLLRAKCEGGGGGGGGGGGKT